MNEIEEDVERLRLLNIYQKKMKLIYEECHDSKNLWAFVTVMTEFSGIVENALNILEEEFINEYFEEKKEHGERIKWIMK
jgi:hypothetical protein